MEPGLLALVAVFAVAAALLWMSFARGRAVERALLHAGFAPCPLEEPALARAMQDVAGGHPPAPRREYRIGRCYKRPGGHGMVYRIGVVDRTNANIDSHSDRTPTGGRFDVYLIDLPDPERVSHGPVSVFLSPGKPGVLSRMLAALVKLDPHGVPLELPDTPFGKTVLAAFSDRAAKLDELLPAETQERLGKASSAGVFAAHFGARKLALLVHPERPDVVRELAYVAEWA